MKKSNDPRHLARILAVQYLFSQDFRIEPGMIREEYSPEELASIDEVDRYDTTLYNSIVNGITEKKEAIDKLITQYAPQWPVDQIKKVDLAILRIAIFEGFISQITPPKVAIDEAIELAKDFGGSTSDKFVNGVLGALYEKNKTNE